VGGDDKGSGTGHHVAWRKAWEVWDSSWWGGMTRGQEWDTMLHGERHGRFGILVGGGMTRGQERDKHVFVFWTLAELFAFQDEK